MKADTVETFVTAAANSVLANAAPAASISDGERRGKSANRRCNCRRHDMRQSRGDGNEEHCSAPLISTASLLCYVEKPPENRPPPKQWTLPDKSPRLSIYSERVLPTIGRSTFTSQTSALMKFRRESSTAPPALGEDVGRSRDPSGASSLRLRSHSKFLRRLRAVTKVVGSLKLSSKQVKPAALVRGREQGWARLRKMHIVTRKLLRYGRLGSVYSDDEESSSSTKSEEEGFNNNSRHGLRRTRRRRGSSRASCSSSAIWSEGSDKFRDSSESSLSVESGDEVRRFSHKQTLIGYLETNMFGMLIHFSGCILCGVVALAENDSLRTSCGRILR